MEPLRSWLRVARLVRPQGHRGEVLAELLTDFPERFDARPTLHARSTENAEPSRLLTVEQARMHGSRIVLRFAECPTMNDAELLRGWELVIPWEQRAALAEDEVYIAELVGCTLTDTATGDRVGTVTDVDRESSATELLVVETATGELLVPFVKAYEPVWDLPTRDLRMRLPAGLLETVSGAGARADTTDAGDDRESP